MKKSYYIITVFIICSFAAIVMGAEPGSPAAVGPYNPTISYPGDYQTDVLLFRNSPNDTIWRNIPKINRLSKVTCVGALQKLQREGKWQGHLNLDGSCGPTAEPANWALGNRLNYDEALTQDAR